MWHATISLKDLPGASSHNVRHFDAGGKSGVGDLAAALARSLERPAGLLSE